MFGLLFIISSSPSLSQTYHLKKEVLDMFADTKNDIWVTTYMGYESSIYPVDFILGHDGDKYKGIMYYPDVREKIYFEGTGNTTQFILEEYNDVGQHIGRLNIEKKGQLVVGDWISVETKKSMSVLFIEDKVQRYELPKSMDMLAGSFSTLLNNSKFNIKCYKVADDLEVYFSNNEANTHITMKMASPGIYTSTEEINLGDLSLSKAQLILQDEEKLLSLMVNRKQLHLNLLVNETIGIERDTYVTPYSKVNIESIETSNGKLYSWLNKKLEPLVEDVNLIKEKNRNNEYSYIDRNTETVGASLKITYLDPRYISGNIYTYRLKSINEEPFIYDRQKDKIIKWRDLVNDENILDDIKKNLKGKNQLMIDEKGLLLIGEYDLIRGASIFQISYKELKNRYNKLIINRNFRKHFLK